MPIKNLSEVRRLPRLGKIALGIKKKSEKSGAEFPTEVDYFVCPPAVQKVFGDKPKELRIMFPVANPEVFFSQWNKRYGAAALKCKGDGERAWAWDDESGGIKEIACPCDRLKDGSCKPVGVLQFLIPEVEGAGIYQITTSSKASIVDINSSLDFIKAVAGRIHMIPLILKREERNMTRTEDGKQKKSTHYTLKLDIAEGFTLRQLQESAQVRAEVVMLPPADESKDDLIYPENGFAPIEAEAKPITSARAGAATAEDLVGGDDDSATLEQVSAIADLSEALRQRGKTDAFITAKIAEGVQKKHKIDMSEVKTMTVEVADTVIALLKAWIHQIDATRKLAGN